MATQRYFCEAHGLEFEVNVPFGDDVPKVSWCPFGPHMGFWRPSAPYFIVKGGTGASREQRALKAHKKMIDRTDVDWKPIGRHQHPQLPSEPED